MSIQMITWAKKPFLVTCLLVVSLAVLCLAVTVMGTIFQEAVLHCPPSAPASSTETTAQSSDRIAFTTWCDRNGEVYVINADGSNLTNLTNDEVPPRDWLEVERPLWLHDSDDEIYVMDADGSNLIQLTDNTVNDQRPTWSP